ncbi:hypothetical protein ACFL2X_04215 [Candidatus Latescibacterota bacterium]
MVITISEWISFTIALWIIALLAFYALREFFSLVDIRIEDRFGILISYLSIPFMFYLIQIDWYGLFIIAIPVYTFLIMPFFVALGRKARGIVFSVGVLDFGLFFYVFCMGHISYLIYFSERITMLVVVAVAVTDSILRYMKSKHYRFKFLMQIICTCSIFMITSEWSGIPLIHSAALGIITPILACIGFFTLKELEHDLGIRAERLQPGRGKTIEALKLYLYSAPVFFHYLRWFMKWGDLP